MTLDQKLAFIAAARAFLEILEADRNPLCPGCGVIIMDPQDHGYACPEIYDDQLPLFIEDDEATMFNLQTLREAE